MKKKNLGNFVEYFKEIYFYCSELKEHLETLQKTSVTYLTSFNQNEMTEVIGKKIILQDIIEEIKTADFPSISADKVAASNDEIH